MVPPRSIGQYEKSGLVYEKKFGQYASMRWGGDKAVKVGQWIKYANRYGKWCWAQPDVLMIDEDNKEITIFECKRTYRPRKAKAQLEELYAPLLRKLFPDYTFILVQVCRQMGGKHVNPKILIKDYRDAKEGYNVWNWKPIPL